MVKLAGHKKAVEKCGVHVLFPSHSRRMSWGLAVLPENQLLEAHGTAVMLTRCITIIYRKNFRSVKASSNAHPHVSGADTDKVHANGLKVVIRRSEVAEVKANTATKRVMLTHIPRPSSQASIVWLGCVRAL